MRRAIRILAVGIATLNHESRNDSMKRRAVIETFLRKFREILHMPGRHIVKKLQDDLAQLRPFAADGNRGSCILRRL